MRCFNKRFIKALFSTPLPVLIQRAIALLRLHATSSYITIPLEKGLKRAYRKNFFEQLQTRTIPRFIPLPVLSPQNAAKMRASADLICENKIALLGSGIVWLGDDINWHFDFKHQKNLSTEHIIKIATLQPGGGSDIKVPWELSRFQFLPTLWHAWRATDEEKYPAKAASLILDWIKKNPCYHGVNWKCTMDTAIRACNWILCWQLFANTQPFSDKHFQKVFFTSLLEHGRYIYRNLEYGTNFNSNHFLADITGLFFLGVMLPEYKEAKKWLTKGLLSIEEEMQKQVYNDGVDFEASISYHRLATELFGYCALLCDANNIPLSAALKKRLRKMFNFAHDYTKPNGLAPQIGDNDDGRLFIFEDFFGWEKRDHTHLFWLEERLFPKEIAAEHAAKLNVVKSSTSPQGDAIKTAAYVNGGIYIMRSAKTYCIVDCGSNGQMGNAGHAHNDTLSFEYVFMGEDIIVDPGTYVYTSNPEQRLHFRSTRMHNSVTVDFQEMNRFRDDSLFSMHNDAVPRVLAWNTSLEGRDFLQAEHSGYERLSKPVTHRRKFELDKKAETLEIADEFHGQGSHTFEWNFHFAPGVTLHPEAFGVIAQKGDVRVELAIPSMLRSGLIIREDQVSPSYGVKEPALVATISARLEVPTKKFVFVLR